MDTFLWFVVGMAVGAAIVWFVAQNAMHTKIADATGQANQMATAEREARMITEARLAALQTSFGENDKRLKDSFEALAANTLQNNASMFLKLADEVMQKNIVQTKSTIEAGKEAIQQMLTPVKSALEKQEKLMQQVGERHESLFAHMRSGIELLDSNQRKLEKETPI